MVDRPFIDTNIFVCSVDIAEPDKQVRAQQLLSGNPDGVVSTQVLNEFYNTVTRKLPTPLSADAAAAIVERMAKLHCVPVDADLVLRAIRAGQRWQLSHWDALMVAAARQAGCNRLLTEDLTDGASYDGLRVENPW